MLQVCEMRWDFTRQMVWWFCGFAHFSGSIGCTKCILLATLILFHPCFFAHSINQGWPNLFKRRVICRKPKTPASFKTSLLCLYKYAKECKFYINWCTVIVSIKFLFDFLVPENLDSTTNFITEKKIHSNMLC